jgi:hypothetical protein
MCGIVGALSFNDMPVNDTVLQVFENQRTRGLEGFGLYDYEYKNLVRSTTEHGIKKWLRRYPSSNILFHHRLPTSTKNVKNACHPFSTKDHFKTNYVLVHNGYLFNDDDLKEAHELKGIKYHSEQPDGTFNDSEALLWDIALYLEGKQKTVKAEGAIAFICIAITPGKKANKMYFGRNTSPLKMLHTEEGLLLSSEGPGVATETDTLYTFNYDTRKLTTKELKLPMQTYNWKGYQNYNYNGYYDSIYEDWGDEDYEFYSGSEKQMIEEGRKLTKSKPLTDDGYKLQMKLLTERVMREASGFYAEAIKILDKEYDCVATYNNHQYSVGHNQADTKHTLEVYEDVVDALESHEDYVDSTSQVLYEKV